MTPVRPGMPRPGMPHRGPAGRRPGGGWLDTMRGRLRRGVAHVRRHRHPGAMHPALGDEPPQLCDAGHRRVIADRRGLRDRVGRNRVDAGPRPEHHLRGVLLRAAQNPCDIQDDGHLVGAGARGRTRRVSSHHSSSYPRRVFGYYPQGVLSSQDMSGAHPIASSTNGPMITAGDIGKHARSVVVGRFVVTLLSRRKSPIGPGYRQLSSSPVTRHAHPGCRRALCETRHFLAAAARLPWRCSRVSGRCPEGTTIF
jgi:hypothetical protein